MTICLHMSYIHPEQPSRTHPVNLKVTRRVGRVEDAKGKDKGYLKKGSWIRSHVCEERPRIRLRRPRKWVVEVVDQA